MVPVEPGHWAPKPLAGLHFLEVEDGSIILDPAGRKIHSLNAWGTIVWLLCDGRRSAQRIVELTGRQNEQLRASVIEILEILRREGLVEALPVGDSAQ
ncbi:PqqD family protein [Nitrospira sp. Kam-Ns4a]